MWTTTCDGAKQPMTTWSKSFATKRQTAAFATKRQTADESLTTKTLSIQLNIRHSDDALENFNGLFLFDLTLDSQSRNLHDDLTNQEFRTSRDLSIFFGTSKAH